MTYRFQFRRFRLPFRQTMRTTHGLWSERHGAWVRLETETGKVGFGEAAPIAHFGTETMAEIEAACTAFGDAVEEATLARVPESMGCLRHAIGSAIDECRAGACADGMEAGPDPKPEGQTPVHKLESATLRGNEQKPGFGPEASSSGSVTQTPDYLSVAGLLPAGRAALVELPLRSDAGFRIFKWKVGIGDPRDELGLLDELCALLPEGAKVRLDANGAWDRRTAERWLAWCAERPIEFLEQPVAPSARGAQDILCGLAADYPTPIALDESVAHDRDIDRWLALGWRGVFVLKLALLAAPRQAVAKLAHARAAVVFSSALETAVAARSALRLAFTWPGNRRALGYGVWPLFADRRFDAPGSGPFLYRADVERIDPEAIWNALS